MSQSDASSNQASQSPALPPPQCAGGCGFYGNKDQKNCCSVCFKKMYPEEASQQEKAHGSSSKNKPIKEKMDKSKDANTESKEDDKSKANVEEESKPKRKVQKKKNRCWNCRKKVTLAGQFECKCGYVYCAMHRYPDAHSCDFDHKQQHKDKLAKDNKTVAPPKLVKF